MTFTTPSGGDERAIAPRNKAGADGDRSRTTSLLLQGAVALVITAISAGVALGHGDMAPQAVDTTGLPTLGEEWKTNNPYRDAEPEILANAIEIGARGYNSNCARCHGLDVISGGLAPDLRFLEANEMGDEWFVDRFVNGYIQDGVTKMPSFGAILSQEAGWAIRTYIETRPDSDQFAEMADELRALLDTAQKLDASDEASVSTIAGKIEELNDGLETYSGAPRAYTGLVKAAKVLRHSPVDVQAASAILAEELRK